LSKYGTDLGQTQTQRKYQSWWWKDLFKVCGKVKKRVGFKKQFHGEMEQET